MYSISCFLVVQPILFSGSIVHPVFWKYSLSCLVYMYVHCTAHPACCSHSLSCNVCLFVVCTASPCFCCPYCRTGSVHFIKADNYSGSISCLFYGAANTSPTRFHSTYHVKYGKCLLVEISPMQQIALQVEGGCSDMMILKIISQG